jgi:hypothetical protein
VDEPEGSPHGSKEAFPIPVDCGKGRPSSLAPIQDEILQWLFELRQDGMPVSVRLFRLQICKLDGHFRRKAMAAQYSIARQFLSTHKITLRRPTHEAQCLPATKVGEALQFIARMQALVSTPNRDERYVINMDQTPVYFSMTPTTTLEKVGARTVNMRNSSGSTMYVCHCCCYCYGFWPHPSLPSCLQRNPRSAKRATQFNPSGTQWD